MVWHPQVLQYKVFMKQTLTATSSWYGHITLFTCLYSSIKYRFFSTLLSYIQHHVLCESKDWFEMWVNNNQNRLRKIPEERRPQPFTCLLLWTLCLTSLCLNQNVPISLGRWGCSCIQSFRCSTASLTRCSFRPNSPLTFSSTSLVGGSITCSDILCLQTQKTVRF